MIEFSLARKGLTAAGHVSSSDLIEQAGTNGNGSQLLGCAEA